MPERIRLQPLEQREAFPDAPAATAEQALRASASGAPCALYIHVPFCFHKCHYCDFYSLVDRPDAHDAYLDALTLELDAMARVAHPGPITSIFVGGGTPTLLSPAHWRRLLEHLRSVFDCSRLDAGLGEFTVECNPETATAELCETLAAGGVTRVSVGAQSFNRAHLKTLERWHEPESVGRALALFRDAGIRRRSLDLIFAIPGQSLADLDADLDEALSLDPDLEHISCYCLTYEPDTPMTVRRDRGEFTPASEARERAMLERVVDRLASAGLARYEVSNFATPGCECLHNLNYWRQGAWLAAGPAAAGHALVEPDSLDPALAPVGVGWRWKNAPHLRRWMTGVRDNAGLPPVVDLEPPDPRRALRERLMTGLRLSEGLDAGVLLAAADVLRCAAALQTAASRLRDEGLLATGDRWRCTRAGFAVADAVAADLMARI